MKARNLLWITVVDIFLLLLVSVIMEYGDLNSRFKQLQNTVSTAVETSIRTSTASEELFSQQYKLDTTTSFGTKSDATNKTESTLKVLSEDGNSWIEGNTYVMAKYYEENDEFPKTQGDYDSYHWGTDEDIYEWLFGNVGTVYKSYYWANNKTKLWTNLKLDSYGSDRTPTTNFKNFYNNIGKCMTSNAYVKTQSAGGTFDVEVKEIPTLTQMGLQLDETYNGNQSGGSSITNDYLSSVVHFGKASNGIADTSYYLTPYSLGVTYVPIEVLKPAFLSHLEQLVRFNKVKHTVTNAGDLTDFASADGCMSTEVYVGGTTNQVHKESSSLEDIINDGNIEYDLSTVKVKVDYFLVDFYNEDNYLIANRVEGSTPYESNLTKLPQALKDKDTSIDKNGNRIVAKVSVKMKIHVPYKSSILQWFRQLNHSTGGNHYDIRLWDDSSGSAELDSDGLWYYYTTYTAVSR